ncbi:MAG: outer membrane lipoprotein carrier protein LolA [Bacteroidales bacterium]
MKKYITLIALILAVSTIFAQQDPEAKKILDNLSAKTKSYKNIQIDFKVEYVNLKDNFKNSSQGTITLQDEKYKLDFMGIESYFDGKTLYSYIIESNEVNISEPEADDSDILNNPKQIFTLYEKDYKYQLISESTENETSYTIVDLYPIDLNKEYSRIRLQINTSDYQLKSATIFGKDGSNYSLIVSAFKPNQAIDNKLFIFDESKYPGVEKIDLRW